MLKVLIICVSLISFPMDFNVSSSIGFIQNNTYIGDYWSEIDKRIGFDYRILTDIYFNDYFGVGFELSVFHLYGLEGMIDEEDSVGVLCSPYLLTELPLNSGISLLAQVGFGTVFIVPSFTLNYGMRLKIDITRKLNIGLMFDEKLEGAVLADYDGFRYFLLRSYSLFIGYDL